MTHALDDQLALPSAQSPVTHQVFVRRLVFAALATASIGALLAVAALALSAGGFDWVDLLLLALFGVTTPWLAIGFWNAVIGFFIMRFTPNPTTYVVPQAARATAPSAIVASTAIVMCVRNEPPERAIRNLNAMMIDIDAAGFADRFHVYVLSDTSRPELLPAEAEAFSDLARQWSGRFPVIYRRRDANTGYKAGNIRDFLERWGDAHELMVTLDADSYMPASAILRMVGIVQANPNLGILQGLVVGLPSTSAFARIFQFGMRLGMRSWTIGSAWWQADCGPYWGHNAVIRIAPFKQHCVIPAVPGKGILRGHVLSHDQIEAALMRRAGYDVRVLPDEDLGWEENPPTLIEFVRRDQRWCQGTLQYIFFLGSPGLHVVSRFQLLFAMLMFLGSPAWLGVLLVSTAALMAAPSPAAFVDADYGAALLAMIVAMWLAPKAATIFDVLSRPRLRRLFGGASRFLASILVETSFFLLLSPIMWTAHTLLLAKLPFGHAIGWIEQMRESHAVSWSTALRQLWPQTMFGIACLALLGLLQPAALPYVFVLWAGGLALSIPLCVITSYPPFGHALARIGIGRLPEETDPPGALQHLHLEALRAVHPIARN